LSEFRADERAVYRNVRVGFVWQMHYLLPEFTALENVMLPQLMRVPSSGRLRRKDGSCWRKWAG